MNTLILDFLNSYADNTNPQYAVMLKGKWGCGKTHLQYERTVYHCFKNSSFSGRFNGYGNTSANNICHWPSFIICLAVKFNM